MLDIGTGPAPALYAIDDFYAAFSEFDRDADVPELQVPQPELSCIERSQPMVWFFHAFSEFAGRRGPFGPAFSDFAGFDLAATRMWHQRQMRWNSGGTRKLSSTRRSTIRSEPLQMQNGCFATGWSYSAIS